MSQQALDESRGAAPEIARSRTYFGTIQKAGKNKVLPVSDTRKKAYSLVQLVRSQTLYPTELRAH